MVRRVLVDNESGGAAEMELAGRGVNVRPGVPGPVSVRRHDSGR